MTFNRDGYPNGEMLDGGRFVFNELLGGVLTSGVWRGEQQYPIRRNVIITFRSAHYNATLDDLLRYDASGVAPVLFIGSPDGYQKPRQKTNLGWDVAVVEVKPNG